MKKLKLFMFVALFGAMSFGAFSAYDYVTMSAEERTLLENVEALTSNEGGSNGLCRAPYTESCMTIYPNGAPVLLPGVFVY